MRGPSARGGVPVRRRNLLAGAAAGLVSPLAGCYDRVTGDEDGTDEEWAMPHGDAANTGTTQGSSPSLDPGVRWRFETDSAVHATPVVANGIAYVGTVGGHLYALDADRGEVEWDVDHLRTVSSAAVVDDRVYVGARWEDDAGLVALDAESGDIEWTHGAGVDAFGPPTVVDGVVFAEAPRTGLLAIDAGSGEEWWRAELPGEFHGAPALYGGAVYLTRRLDVGSDGGRRSAILALDAATGEELWSVEREASIVHSPVVSNGTLYANRFALDPDTGSQRWATDADVGRSAPAVAGATVFVAGDGDLRALDAETGEQVWLHPEFGTGGTAPIVAAGTVYATGSDGALHAIAADTGSQRWRREIVDRPKTGEPDAVGSTPAVAGGAVFVGSTVGSVYAFE